MWWLYRCYWKTKNCRWLFLTYFLCINVFSITLFLFDAKKIVIFYIWGFSVLFTRYDDIRCTKHTGTLYVVVVVVMVLGSSRWYCLWQRAVQTHHMDSNHWYVIERKSTRATLLHKKEKMIFVWETIAYNDVLLLQLNRLWYHIIFKY